MLKEVNDLLYPDNETMMFVTVVYAVYDPATGQVTYANAGHNPPLIVHPDGSSSVIPSTGGVALGVMPDIDFKQNTVTCAPGDILICYTDGVTEAMNADGEEFGLERLREIFQNNIFGDSHEVTQAILDAVSAFAGETAQSDDITCLALRHIGGSS